MTFTQIPITVYEVIPNLFQIMLFKMFSSNLLDREFSFRNSIINLNECVLFR